MPTCGNCRKQGATVAEIRDCYKFAALLDSPELADVLALPEQERPEITDGMWKLGDTIYKVQWNLAKTNLYGKRLDLEATGPDNAFSAAVFVYEAGVPRKLAAGFAHKLTLEEAKEFGALYGTCCVCGRTLTNEASIEAGIGPICAGRLV